MPGRGPAPKPAARWARKNRDTAPQVVLEFRKGDQPELPDDIDWHPRTRAWWATWGRAAQAETFTETDWDFLMDTALLHHAVWAKGESKLAGELRLRVAKMGATPEDRARLRMVFADADEKDERRAAAKRGAASRARRGPLRAI